MGLLSLPQQSGRFGLLTPQLDSAIASARALPAYAPQPTAPQRNRVSGWRLLDRVLGGQTVSEGLDTERARLQAEAMRPQMEAQRQQILASITDPRERALFMASPDDWAKNVGQQFAPQVIAAGAGQAIGGRMALEQPRTVESGDQVLQVRSDGVTPLYTRTAPSISEQTARMTAERPLEIAPGTIAYNRDGSEFARGAQRVFSAADGAQIIGESTGLMAENTKDAPPIDPAVAAQRQQAAAAAEQARGVMATNLQTGLTGARRFVDAAGAWTNLMPWQRQNRANLEGHLDTLKGNITFEKLSEMKANSPNGASGLGALSDNEARMLASTVAALSPDMSPQELERSFGVIDGLVAKLQQPSGAAGGVVTVSTPQEAAALPPGTRYRNPQGREFVR